MLDWTEELSQFTLTEVMQLQTQNWKRGGELRRAALVLVNQRLAKQITLEDYFAQRQCCRDEEEECQRRGRILLDELVVRRIAASTPFRVTEE